MRFIPRLVPLLAAIAILTVLTAQPVFASEGQTKTAAGTDKQAQAVLKNFSSFVSGLESLSLRVSVSTAVEVQGMKQKVDVAHTFALKRPNLFALRISQGSLGGEAVNDGEHLYTYAPSLTSYMEASAPKSFAEYVERGEYGMLQMAAGSSPVLLAMFHEDPQKALTEGLDSLVYGGVEEVDGTSCHRLELADESATWTIWIDDGDQPWVRKAAADMSEALKEMGIPAAMLEGAKMENTVHFTDWKADPELSGDTFAFSPPQGAQKVSSFRDAVARAQPGPPRPGDVAPDFAINSLTGEETTLSAFKGEKVVVLDFWATWCPPCRQGLPLLDKVAKSYKSEDVVFYAVNQRESQDKIRGFVEQTGLELPVALDENKRIGSLYQIDNIPQTFIIGKDGTVQGHHRGFSPSMDGEIRSALDTLLSGKNLVD